MQPSSPPRLILVTGPPASGKTTLARRLTADLGLPLITKDDIKERLFDTLGAGDREWSKRLGAATYALFYYWLEALLAAGQSSLAEANFHLAYDPPKLNALQAQTGCRFVQIACTAAPAILAHRYAERWASGQRHPGHVDHLVSQVDLATAFERGAHGPLPLAGPLFVLDTSDFARVDYDGLLTAIRAALSPATRATG